MKKIKYMLMFFVLISCQTKKFIIKKIKINSVTLCWYRESYISSTRAFVSLDEKGIGNTVLVCNDINITDIALKKDSIVISIFDLKNAAVYNRMHFVNNYIIILKEASYEDWFKHYHPNEKFHSLKGL